MDKEEIITQNLEVKKEQLTKKIEEMREIIDQTKSQMDIIGEEENTVWYSDASKNLYDKFLNDYNKYLQLDDSFHTIVEFLNQVCSGYEDLNAQIIDNIGKIEDTKIE